METLVICGLIQCLPPKEEWNNKNAGAKEKGEMEREKIKKGNKKQSRRPK